MLSLLVFALAADPVPSAETKSSAGLFLDTPANVSYPFSIRAGGFGDKKIPRVAYFAADGSFYTRAAFVMGGGWVQTPGGDARGPYGSIVTPFAWPGPGMAVWNDTAAGCIGVRLSPAERKGQWLFQAKDFGPGAATENDLNPATGSFFFGIDPYGVIKAGPPSYNLPGAAKVPDDMDTSFGRVAPGVWKANGGIAFGKVEPPDSVLPAAGDGAVWTKPDDPAFPVRFKVRMSDGTVSIVALPRMGACPK